MKIIRKTGKLLLYISLCLLATIGLMKVLALSFYVSALFAIIGSVLFYLMLDSKPEADPKDATITRLKRGSWQRKS